MLSEFSCYVLGYKSCHTTLYSVGHQWCCGFYSLPCYLLGCMNYHATVKYFIGTAMSKYVKIANWWITSLYVIYFKS